MRLLEIELARYGPFSGEILTFRPGAGVHVVYGPNEAGKSCALAAITDLFFGIERQTRYAFLHDGRELCLGAKIATVQGAPLQFRRRKNKPVLTDARGQPLSDDALAPFLDGLSRQVFCRAFGLDAAALRASGDDLKKSDGELGASLFAAASGLRGLNDLRADLDREADTVFAPRAKRDRRFYHALDRYEEARKKIRELELRSNDWKDLNEAIEHCTQRLQETEDQRANNAADQARLSRLKRAAPIVRLIDADEAAVRELGVLPATAPGFAQRLRDSLDRSTEARVAHTEATAREKRLVGEYDAIALDETLLADQAETERLFGETGAYRDSRTDVPRIEAEARALSSELDGLARRLGLRAGSAPGEQQPSDAAQAKMRALAEEGRRIETELAGRSEEAGRERGAAASLQREAAGRGRIVDPTPLREKLNALSPVLAKLAQHDAALSAVVVEARSIRDAASRLSPPIEDLEALSAAPMPSSETVSRSRMRLDELDQAIRRERERIGSSQGLVGQIEERLRDLGGERAFATPEMLAGTRAARDERWLRLRSALFGGSNALSGAELGDVVSAFERLTGETDRLADELASNAERIFAIAGETRRLAREQATQRDAVAQLTGLENSLGAEVDAWNAAWAGAGIAPLSPAEMALWLVTAGNLLERRDRLAARRAEAAAIEAQATRLRPQVEALAAELGLSPMPELDLRLAAGRIEDRLKSLAQSWDAARDLEARLRATAERLESAERALQQAAERLSIWRESWATAAPTIGLEPAATLAEAGAALDAWKEVPRILRERDDRLNRVAGMRRNIGVFESDARTLLGRHGDGPAAVPVDAGIKHLRQRLSETLKAQARRQEKGRQLEEARVGRADAAQGLEAAERTLAELTSRLGDIGGDTLDALARRLAERERLDVSLRTRRAELANAADGHDEAALREALVGFDPDTAEGALVRLREADDRLDREAKEVFADKDRHERRRTELEQGVGAEVALQQRRGAEAELTEAARDYAVLKLGSLIVGSALERQRSRREDPLMSRAGVLFGLLTGGAYIGLAQEFDDDDTPHLSGQRPCGKTVRVTDMSEGTRDQLYLALRFAYLEEYAARSEPAPFIGDDLVTSFDDQRTGNAFEALAAIGRTVQPILFTHHPHVVAIAIERLGPAVDVIRLGGAASDAAAGWVTRERVSG